MTTNISPHLESSRGDLGQGVYGLSELRTLLAVYGNPDDGKHAYNWLRSILNPVDHDPWQADYSFSDLISLFVVKQLLLSGMRPRTIRDAEKYLRDKWCTDRPFAKQEIQFDAAEVFCDRGLIPQQIEAAGKGGQQTILAAVEQGLKSVFYADGSAAYWTPEPGILVDPRVQFGQPVVEGTRIPTEAVAGVASKLGVEQAILRFQISPDLVNSAIAFETRIASFN